MDKLPVDQAADVELGEPHVLAKGYRDYLRYRLTLRNEGQPPLRQERDILVAGPIIAVLPVDLARGEVVLIRQFRLAAHLASGKGEMLEIVAGGVERGENAETAARRECAEEIGVPPGKLVKLFSFMTTPGITDETIDLFLASVDASRVPPRSGAANEGERIATIRLPIDDAVALVQSGGIANGPLMLALQWLALNQTRLSQLLT